MKSLAVDLSSLRASLALLDGPDVRAEVRWEQSRENSQALFGVWRGVLADHRLRPADIGLYACGRGPGSFSGTRMAITAVRLAAGPWRTPVMAVASGDAVAAEAAVALAAEDLVVVGDARRGLRWWRRFRRSGALVEPISPWSLDPPDRWAADAPPSAVAVSPDWTSLNRVLLPGERERLRWVEHDWNPSAGWIARIARARQEAGLASDPLVPLYLHDAVRRGP